jgi:hypothetical protein
LTIERCCHDQNNQTKLDRNSLLAAPLLFLRNGSALAQVSDMPPAMKS